MALYQYTGSSYPPSGSVSFYPPGAGADLASLKDAGGGSIANPAVASGGGALTVYCASWPLYYQVVGNPVFYVATCVNPPATNSSLTQITVSGTAPSSPNINDLWVNTT